MASSAVTPKRIQRKRTKGWKMPPNTVYVGRPTKWGNPWRVGIFRDFTRTDAVNRFRDWILGINSASNPPWRSLFGTDARAAAVIELRGKDLACWCKEGQPCHADILLEIANSREDDAIVI